jgi:heme/copper-type cytochrome/quinol oxidase subunit 2
MKRITGRVLSSLAVLANNAQAVIAMPEREHVQTIVWIIEAVTFVTIAAVFWFVWRISMRAKENRKSRQED